MRLGLQLPLTTLAYHAHLPRSLTTLTHHAHSPRSLTTLTHHAPLPRSLTTLAYHAHSPRSLTTLAYHAHSPRSPTARHIPRVTYHASHTTLPHHAHSPRSPTPRHIPRPPTPCRQPETAARRAGRSVHAPPRQRRSCATDLPVGGWSCGGRARLLRRWVHTGARVAMRMPNPNPRAPPLTLTFTEVGSHRRQGQGWG